MQNILGSESANINLNIDQRTLQACLKEVSNIGSTTYQNICTGQSAVVAWGTQDWMLSIFLFSMAAVLVGLVIVAMRS